MKKALLLFAMLFAMSSSFGQSCHTYITQLSNGNLKFSVTLPTARAYVEVFVRQNGIQNVAQNIVSSQVANANGTYTYSYTAPAGNYTTGDAVITRFYSYESAGPGVFTPGPAEQVWSSIFYYNQSCNNLTVYVSTSGSDSNPGTVAAPVRTISYGYNLAKNTGAKNVKVSAGTYNEGTTTFQYNTSLVTLANGINLLGGYSTDFTQRNIATYVTKLVAPNGGTQNGGPRIIYADGITESTVVEGFEFNKGVSQTAGGGISISNSNANLVIKNNKIIDNYASYQGKGGNVYLYNSSAKVLNNTITNGFAGMSTNGSDMFIQGNLNGVKAEVANNVFTRPSAVVGSYDAIFTNNTFLFAARAGFDATTDSEAGALTMSIENNIVRIMGAGENLQVLISDMSGKTFMNTSIPMVSLEEMQPGIYIIRASDNVSSVTEKVMIK